MQVDELVQEIELQRSLMITTATSADLPRNANHDYMERRRRIGIALQQLGLRDPNPFGDLSMWHGKWSSGDLPTYESRRQYAKSLYAPLISELNAGVGRDLKPKVSSRRSSQGSKPRSSGSAEAANKGGFLMDDDHQINQRDVFVIHGRDQRLADALVAFLRALDLHPIDWEEAVKGTGKGSPNTSEVLDYALEHAQALVVLMTPDDEVRLRADLLLPDDKEYERQLTGQARPNVLFEAGMALGRNEKRTVLVTIGDDLRRISDLVGRHVIRMDGSPSRRNALAARLETAGCQVKRGGGEWLKVGTFDHPHLGKQSPPPKRARKRRSEKPNFDSLVASEQVFTRKDFVD